jgi:hypothetical protein
MHKPPVSAVVVSRDEGDLLDSCLATLDFCDEVIVVDLESRDDSADIARRHGATVVRRPPVPIVELLYEEMANMIRNPWLLLLDPDEAIDPRLAHGIRELLEYEDLTTTGLILAPMRLYFRSRPIRGGIWGPQDHALVARVEGVSFSSRVHQGLGLRPGYESIAIPPRGGNVIHHRWMRGYRQLMRKHRRYVHQEGRARHAAGERFAPSTLMRAPIAAAYRALVTRRGYRDGLRGVVLAVLWSWYQAACVLSLRRHERDAVPAGAKVS